MTEQLYTNIPPLRPCMCGHGDHYQINGRCLTPGCGCAGRTVDKTGASDAEFRARVAAFDAAPTPPEVREAAVLAAVTEALLITVLGTDDRDFLTGCGELPVDEIARLIVEHGAAAAVAAFDTAQVPPECDPARVETVARAIAEAQGVGRTATPLTRRLAAAAIAADPSPAEEAVKRQSAAALCDLTFEVVGRYVTGSMHNAIAMEVNRCVLPAALGITEADLRAALASPAPAPQGEEGQR